jgi:hypothetical protein
MRTTITVDDELIRDLKTAALEQHVPFKSLLGVALRAGMATMSNKTAQKPYRGRAFRLGNPTGLNLDKSLNIAAEIETEETVRKLLLRK